ncbi:MAG: hypothetical protein IH612_05160 [Desulfofustis sp.]|nr:hypothetical protein [Desulfofustis sp.]
MMVILVAGPSGSGKDTLIQAARQHFDGGRGLAFARRYITRPPDEHEDNYFISREGFAVLQRADFFMSSWQAHGFDYGIARSDCFPINGARAVLVSVSRTAIADFECRLDEVVTIQVWAALEVLEQRLHRRGRENGASIRRRLQRAIVPVQARRLVPFDNSGELRVSQESFVGLLERLVNCRQVAV